MKNIFGEEVSELAQAGIGDKVKIHFTCKLEDGTIYDSSADREPLQFTIGEGKVLPGLESAVIGMELNESKHAKISADDVFGPHHEEKRKTISRQQFPNDFVPEVGMKFEVHGSDGKTNVITITDVSEADVTLDSNHPLAGKDLYFEIQLLEIEQTNISRAYDSYIQGIAFHDKGEYDQAISCYDRAIKLNPTFAEAYYNLGVALQEKGELDKAILSYQFAIGNNMEYAEAYHNLGIAYKESGRLDEAVKCYVDALQANPNYASAHYNLGNALVAKGQYEDALYSYLKAIQILPDYAEAHWNIALINLLNGNFEEGWKRYEWRWKIKGMSPERNFAGPLWDGSDVSGRTILLHEELGFGDTIHFIRYSPMLAERGAKVVLECQRELIPLARNIEGIHQTVVRGEPLPDFDFHCPLSSLPMIFGTTLATIPGKTPYLRVDLPLVQEWQKRLRLDKSKINVGLVWSGDSEYKYDRDRSCPLAMFSPLASCSDVVFYSLQKGGASNDAANPPSGMNLLDYTESIIDFSDTAAFIENLDLVISVDTAVAHLAGALAKPIWVLIPFAPDWRWMLNRDDSPWYPTMRLFRQTVRGEWETVIDRMLEELKSLRHHPGTK